MKFSVLMSVYRNSKPDEVQLCLESLFGQTETSDDLVIVIDGEIPVALQSYLSVVSLEHPEIHLFPLNENVGLGNALKYGMKHCQHELVARMDTDDICDKTRFEKQLKCFEMDPELSIVGSNIGEFVGDMTNVIGYRNVPVQHSEICEYLKKRCPFNHMTVMFRKSEVERSGGYLDWHYNEDSYLWVRMYLAGCKFKNLEENLVYARVNAETYMRRGGWKYYKSERDLFRFMKEKKVIGWFAYQKQRLIRFIVQILMPNWFRQWFFVKFARSRKIA